MRVASPLVIRACPQKTDCSLSKLLQQNTLVQCAVHVSFKETSSSREKGTTCCTQRHSIRKISFPTSAKQQSEITAAEILIRMLPYNIYSAFLFLIFYNGFPAIPVFTHLTNSVNCKGNGIVVVKTR